MLKSSSWRHLYIRTHTHAFLLWMAAYYSMGSHPDCFLSPHPHQDAANILPHRFHAHEWNKLKSWKLWLGFSQGCHGQSQCWSLFLASASLCLSENPRPEAGPSSLCQSVTVAKCGSRQNAPEPGFMEHVSFPSNAQVESFIELIHAGRLTPRDQPKVLSTPEDACGAARWLLCVSNDCTVSKASFAARQTRESQTVSPFWTDSPRLAFHDNDR